MRRDEADSLQFEATYLVLTEVAEILEEFDGAVIAGGTVPFLLIPQEIEPHEGTVDVDLVIDPAKLRGESDATLHEEFVRRLFEQDEKKLFRYWKRVAVGEETREVLIELLAGGTPPPQGMRTIPREDVYVSVIEGMEIALDAPVAASLNEVLSVQVTSISGFLAMKSVALERREDSKKSKDAYDIVYCLRNYPGGVDAIAREFLGRLPNLILEAAIERLTAQFADRNALGPTAYAKRAIGDEEERLLRREAYERVSDLLDRLP